MALLVLPTQLFPLDDKYKTYKTVILWEHPQYFTKFRYNKKKLILHRASMKEYEHTLQTKNRNVTYLEYHMPMNKVKAILKTHASIALIDPIDKLDLSFHRNITILPSPGLLLTSEDHVHYRGKTEHFFFHHFYQFGKKTLANTFPVIQVLVDIPSTDKQNRKKLPKDAPIPSLPELPMSPFVDEAAAYVEEHFPRNYGSVSNFHYPVTRKAALRWLADFLANRFAHFGPYQDAMLRHSEAPTLFHSVLSSSLNIGLLTPRDVLEALPTTVSNSLEAFVRQLFWREYQVYCYRYFPFQDYKTPASYYFRVRSDLGKEWYDGTTGIAPVDKCIRRGFDTAYLHHIERLMVIGNFMTLRGVDPWAGYRWFMEFSIDSYEWVMHQNVLEMVFFVSGGGTMRRPYVSKSHYLLSMSRGYSKGDAWVKAWDETYGSFVKENRERLVKYRYFVRV